MLLCAAAARAPLLAAALRGGLQNARWVSSATQQPGLTDTDGDALLDYWTRMLQADRRRTAGRWRRLPPSAQRTAAASPCTSVLLPLRFSHEFARRTCSLRRRPERRRRAAAAARRPAAAWRQGAVVAARPTHGALRSLLPRPGPARPAHAVLQPDGRLRGAGGGGGRCRRGVARTTPAAAAAAAGRLGDGRRGGDAMQPAPSRSRSGSSRRMDRPCGACGGRRLPRRPGRGAACGAAAGGGGHPPVLPPLCAAEPAAGRH